MPTMTFTDVSLRAVPIPSTGQRSYWDEKLPTFGIRVSQGGSKTFVLKRDNALITIGRFPIIGLSNARAEAKRLLAEFTLGKSALTRSRIKTPFSFSWKTSRRAAGNARQTNTNGCSLAFHSKGRWKI